MELFNLMAKITLDTSEYEKGVKKAGESGSMLGSKIKSGLAAAANVGGKALKGLGTIAGKVASTVGTGLVTATKAAGVGLAAAATGVAALSKQALDAYADYEQLVGGVETLFGAGSQSLEEYAASIGKTVDAASDSYNKLILAQNTVLYDAATAWKDAGMSGNEYMETVTSFSASLLQSLGNDSQKAAEYSKRAVVDMADNANKMGTDMTSIQNAYQGFAKQNYTMLDNLNNMGARAA